VTYLDILISVGVVLLVLIANVRIGQLNPVGTGKLARRLNALEQKVAEQGQRMDGIEQSILTIAGDVGKMTSEVSALRVEVAGDRGLTERTWMAVSRLEGFFIEDSFKQRGRP
jgi:uncharacterized coiled-coil protein SlyX